MPLQDRIPPVDAEAESATSGGVGQAADHLRAAQSYLTHYFAAQFDRVKIAFRNLAVITALAILALVAGIVVIAMSVVLLCTGIAGGLSRLYGGIPWLGDLSTGILILFALIVFVKLGLSRMTASARKQMAADYDRRRSHERAQYGADVHGRSEN
jgi:sterol desaturase/sphingolipid hydroxylase (fatty acid hydroxylase superfamily)